jgi:hypothetical protein
VIQSPGILTIHNQFSVNSIKIWVTCLLYRMDILPYL